MAGLCYKLGDPAEKSPAVHYANWKEDMLLEKQLHVLNRSEKNVIHRIKIDQKVLFKRFQDKLHRSQLTKARMLGDKELERELRASNLHGLNVDIVNTEKDFEFLEKLKSGSTRSPAKTKRKVKASTDKEMDNIIKKVFEIQGTPSTPRARSKSFSEGVTMGMSSVFSKQDKSKKKLSLAPYGIRPATSGGERFDNIEVVLPDMFNSTKLTKGKKNNQFQVNFEQERPNTYSNGTNVIPRSTIHSRRQSIIGTEDKNSRRTSLFSKEEKVDIVQTLLDQMKTVDYTPKVTKFCDSLQGICDTEGENADYYNTRLQAAMKESEKHKPVSVPGTPENEYKRHVGNLNILSLTFKSLNFDFSRRDHSYGHSAAPDLPTVSYVSDDNDDTDSDDDV